MANKFHHWSDAVACLQRRGEGYVLVTVLAVQGSAPRDLGTKMLVSAADTVDTIGGGHLEYAVINKARALLQEGLNQQQLEEFPLGAKLGQCCGGRVQILYECIASTAAPVAVFGAGHVGTALVNLLGQLPVNVQWFDGRVDQFPQQSADNVRHIVSDSLVDEVAELPSQCLVVVLTHQHPLDYAIAEAVLRRGDFRYLGVIGSKTKAKRFAMRLQHRGFDDALIQRMRCPMGLPEVPGKHPMEVAISIAGELVACYQQRPQTAPAQLPASQLKLLQISNSQASE